jgi:hypothetical protein
LAASAAEAAISCCGSKVLRGRFLLQAEGYSPKVMHQGTHFAATGALSRAQARSIKATLTSAGSKIYELTNDPSLRLTANHLCRSTIALPGASPHQNLPLPPLLGSSRIKFPTLCNDVHVQCSIVSASPPHRLRIASASPPHRLRIASASPPHHLRITSALHPDLGGRQRSHQVYLMKLVL